MTCLDPADESNAYTRTLASTNSRDASALMEFVAGPDAIPAGTKRARRAQGGKRPLSGRRIATVFVSETRERFAQQSGHRGVSIDGQPFDPPQQIARHAQRDVLILGHVKK